MAKVKKECTCPVVQSKNTSNAWKEIICFAVGVYFIFNALTLIVGTIEGNNKYSSCHDKVSVGSFIFPGFRTGCWLVKPLESKCGETGRESND